MNKLLLLFSLIGLMILSTGYSALFDNLVNYYTFDDLSSSVINDEWGTEDLNISNVRALNGSGILDYGIDLSLNDYAMTENINAFSGASEGSISLWIKRVTADASNTFMRALSTTGEYSFSMNSDKFNSVGYDSGWVVLGNTPDVFSNDSAWNHFVYSSNSSGNFIFINSVLQSQTYTQGNSASTFFFGDALGGYVYFGRYDTNYWKGNIDELAIFNVSLTQSQINELYNSGNAYNPIIQEIIYDYNVTSITDNTTWLTGSNSNWTINYNTTNNYLLRSFNNSGNEVTQELTYIKYWSNAKPVTNISAWTPTNITSGTNLSINYVEDNAFITNPYFEIFVYNPFNISVNKTITVNINDVKNITYSNSSTFFKYDTTQNLNFTIYLDDENITCNDYYNLTIPNLNITNRLVESCELTSVTFNNSLVYNYTAYLTNERFGRTINNTFYLTTNAYNISIPTYNQTIANNTFTDINLYLTTLPNYLNSNQGVNVSINFNGTTTYLTATGLNYSYIELLTSSELVETVPFYLILNLTSGSESLLFNTSYTQSITTLQIDDCSTYSDVLMWLHIKNELDLDRTELVPNSSVFMSFNINNAYFTLNIVNDTDGVIPVCMNNSVNFSASVDFSFTATNYGALTKPNREHFFFNNYFNTVINQSFYKLPVANAEKIIFNLVDTAQQPLTNYYLEMKKWYGDGYETVAMAKTDINGQAITYVEYNIPNYAFDIRDSNGTLIDSTENIILTTTPTTIQVSVGGSSNYFVDNRTYGVINEWNNSTEYFTTIISNAEGVDTTYNLFVYYSNGTIICSETSTQTTSYTAFCEVPEWENNTFIVKGSVIRNTDGRVLNLYNYLIDDRIPTTPIFDTDEGLLWLAIMMIVSSVGIVAISPSFLPLSPAISLLLTNALGLTSISALIIGGLAVTGIILMLWFMKT